MSHAATLTGRLTQEPDDLLHREVLGPQFAFDRDHLLTAYVRIERVLLAEYRRLGVLDAAETAALAAGLDAVRPQDLIAEPGRNLSDLSFALEAAAGDTARAVLGRVPPAWHVDRSRNDLQATAQLMFGRELLLGCAEAVLAFGHTVVAAARPLAGTPMPGYTHLQAAQVVSPGFYLAALAGEVTEAAGRMLLAYDTVDRCPLGAGAMAGQALAWDRDRMATLLGFAGPVPHALSAVAGRSWHLTVAGELAATAVTLSRFVTDLMSWAGEAYGFLSLPDHLAGISSAMPQKKNYPIFERVRGRLGHVAALATDVYAGQRNTPYANSVEVGKEAGVHLLTMADALNGAVRLLGAALAGARWDAGRMRAALRRAYVGGFALANHLALAEQVPWRTAQVIAGQYIRDALARDLTPDRPRPDLLDAAARAHGHPVADPAAALAALDDDTALQRWRSAGSAAPTQVTAMLTDRARDLTAAGAGIRRRRAAATTGAAHTRRLLGEDLR